jgi:hypothetical protein
MPTVNVEKNRNAFFKKVYKFIKKIENYALGILTRATQSVAYPLA